LGRPTKVFTILVIALFALSAIYFYIGSIEPEERTPGSIEVKDQGSLVEVEGVIKDPFFGEDDASFLLVDPLTGDMVKVYCKMGLSGSMRDGLLPGAGVVVIGEVDIYKGQPEVEVAREDDVRIVSSPDMNQVGLRTIFKNRDSFENMTVSVAGTLVDEPDLSWGDAVFTIEEGSFEAKVRISDFSAQVPFGKGSTVRVVGDVWYEDEGHIRISAQGWTSLTVDI
jgi:hypothetical protein